jgi:manganese oxidase
MTTAPEDAHDSGHMAINYGSEPLWFRFGLPPDAPFGKEGFGGVHNSWEAFSKNCCTNGGTAISADPNVGEPYTPIATVSAGQEMRIRALLPTGSGRGTVVELYGHSWPRDPYLAEIVDETPNGSYPHGSRPFDWRTPAKCLGHNALGMTLGGQESVTPMAHFDMVFPQAGGKHYIPGDYLWRDHAGFGLTNGLWALVRVEENTGTMSPEMLRHNCQ